MDSEGEIILYQPDNTIRLDVRLAEDTVWLTQLQMAELFNTTPQNITSHITNVYKEAELQMISTCKEYLQVQKEGKRTITRKVKYYNLDVIISVGYRVKSIYGTRFRQWANKVLKDYLLKGYSISNRIDNLEKKVDKHLAQHNARIDDITNKVDFFIRTSLPPKEGIFYDGQMYDAFDFIEKLIKSAQYGNLELIEYHKSHDRFLFIDNNVYHIGASLKDLGKKLFAFSKMELSPEEIIRL